MIVVKEQTRKRTHLKVSVTCPWNVVVGKNLRRPQNPNTYSISMGKGNIELHSLSLPFYTVLICEGKTIETH